MGRIFGLCKIFWDVAGDQGGVQPVHSEKTCIDIEIFTIATCFALLCYWCYYNDGFVYFFLNFKAWYYVQMPSGLCLSYFFNYFFFKGNICTITLKQNIGMKRRKIAKIISSIRLCGYGRGSLGELTKRLIFEIPMGLLNMCVLAADNIYSLSQGYNLLYRLRRITSSRTTSKRKFWK